MRKRMRRKKDLISRETFGKTSALCFPSSSTRVFSALEWTRIVLAPVASSCCLPALHGHIITQIEAKPSIALVNLFCPSECWVDSHPKEQFNFPPHLLCVYGLRFIKFRATRDWPRGAFRPMPMDGRSVGRPGVSQEVGDVKAPWRGQEGFEELPCLITVRHGSGPSQFSSSIKRCLRTSSSLVCAVHVSVRCHFIICNGRGRATYTAQGLHQFITGRIGFRRVYNSTNQQRHKGPSWSSHPNHRMRYLLLLDYTQAKAQHLALWSIYVQYLSPKSDLDMKLPLKPPGTRWGEVCRYIVICRYYIILALLSLALCGLVFF